MRGGRLCQGVISCRNRPLSWDTMDKSDDTNEFGQSFGRTGNESWQCWRRSEAGCWMPRFRAAGLADAFFEVPLCRNGLGLRPVAPTVPTEPQTPSGARSRSRGRLLRGRGRSRTDRGAGCILPQPFLKPPAAFRCWQIKSECAGPLTTPHPRPARTPAPAYRDRGTLQDFP
jgi:hypothetical protein